MRALLCAGLLALLCGQSNAQQARLDAQRVQINQEADAAERACNDAFAVNDCVKKVQAHQRQQLAEVKREETALHDVQRKEQAADQARLTAEKLAEREKDVAKRQGTVLDADQRKLQQDEKRREHRARVATTDEPRTTSGAPAQPLATQTYREDYERKRQNAEKNRMDREKRVLEKARSKPVQSLPATPP